MGPTPTATATEPREQLLLQTGVITLPGFGTNVPRDLPR